MLISMTVMCYITCFSCLLFSAQLLRSRPTNRAPCLLLAATFLVLASQTFLLAMILNLDDADIFRIARPSLAMAVGPLFLLFFSSTVDPSFKLKPSHAIHFVPLLIIALELLTETFVLNIDYSIIASFAFYTVWTATKLNHSSNTYQHLGPRKEAAFKWMVGLVVLLATYTLCEVLIYLDVIDWQSLSNSESLLATLSLNVLVCIIALSAALQRPSPFDWLYTYGSTNSRPFAISNTECHDISSRFASLVDSEVLYTREGQSVTAVARRLGISSRALSESIKRTYGESYLSFMNRRRATKAKELLESTPRRPMFDVMMDSGFRSKSTFNKVFKEFQGQTPSEYRDSVET